MLTVDIEVKGLICRTTNKFVLKYLSCYKKVVGGSYDFKLRRFVMKGYDYELHPIYSTEVINNIRYYVFGFQAVKYIQTHHSDSIQFRVTNLSEYLNKLINLSSKDLLIPNDLINSDSFQVDGKDRFYFYEALNACFNSHVGMIKIVTGAGKTPIQLTLAHNYYHYIGTGIILVPTIQIKNQFIKSSKKWGIDLIDFTKFDPSILSDKKCMIIATPKLLYNKITDTDFSEVTKYIKWIILDEVHHAQCSTWLTILRSLSNLVKCHGFSASPYENDLKCITSFNDMTISDGLSLSICGEVVYERSAHELKEFINIPKLINTTYKWKFPARHIDRWSDVVDSMINNSDRSKFISNIITTMNQLEYNNIVHVSNKTYGLNILKYCDEFTVCWYAKDEFYYNDNGVVKSLGMKSKEFSEVYGTKYKTIIATSHLVEGADFSSPINCTILVEGKSNRQVIQKVGRAVRLSPKQSLVINIVDVGFNKTLSTQSHSRMKSIKIEFSSEVLTLDINKSNILKIL